MKSAPSGIASATDYYRNYVESLSRQNRQLFTSPLVWQFDTADLPLKPSHVFPNVCCLFLEIGFGHGEVLEELVQKRTDTGFIGIERRPPRVNKALKRLHRTGCPNVRLIRANLDLIPAPLFAPESFDEILINHPDPWPKRRHEHHRFFRAARMDWLASILKSGGTIEVASDQSAYFFEILRLFQEDSRFSSLLPPPFYSDDPLPDRPMSRFEKRCRSQGSTVRILRFRKNQ